MKAFLVWCVNEEIIKLLKFTTPQMKAIILLGINAGLGPTDLANLKKEHIVDGWLMYPRSKTGVEQRIPLWKEAQEALSAVIRPDDDLVLRTATGRPWIDEFATGVDSPVTAKFRQRCKDLGVYKIDAELQTYCQRTRVAPDLPFAR